MLAKALLMACAFCSVSGVAAASAARTPDSPGSPADVVVLVQGRPIGRGLLLNGTVYLPVRATAEALGVTVLWDARTRVVSLSPITTDLSQPATVPVPVPVPAAPPTPAARAFNVDLQRRALAFLDLQFPPGAAPTRPQLVSPPQPVLPPPVYVPPAPVEPDSGSIHDRYKYARDKRLYENALQEEAARLQRAAAIQADYQRQCDAAAADYQAALAKYDSDLRESETRSRSRSQTLAAANLPAAAAGTPAEPSAWRSLSEVLAQVAARPGLPSEQSATAAELSRLAAQEALLPPSAAPAPLPPQGTSTGN